MARRNLNLEQELDSICDPVSIADSLAARGLIEKRVENGQTYYRALPEKERQLEGAELVVRQRMDHASRRLACVRAVERDTGYKFGRGAFNRIAKQLLTYTVDSSSFGESNYRKYRATPQFEQSRLNVLTIGMVMEDTVDLIKAQNEQLESSLNDLEALCNKVSAISDVIFPVLSKQVSTARQARMTVISEVSAMLAEMKAIRAFMLEADAAKEFEQLERFVKLCREIQSLQREGIFDAVGNAAIRLAIREEKQ